jgi:hypothetical protein
VRFGFSRRWTSQIKMTDAYWREISRLLRGQGVRLVEYRDGPPGHADDHPVCRSARQSGGGGGPDHAVGPAEIAGRLNEA